MLLHTSRSKVMTPLIYSCLCSSVRTPDRPPLNLRPVTGELDLPQKSQEKKIGKGLSLLNYLKSFVQRFYRNLKEGLAIEVPRTGTCVDCLIH